jgi:hypothetical protein
MRNSLIIIISLICFNAFSQEIITATQAKDFAGKEVFLVGKVVGTKLFQRPTGNMLLLNIDKMFPENDITVVIEGDILAKAKFTEANLQGKSIKVKGLVSIFKEKPQIKLQNEVDLTIVL